MAFDEFLKIDGIPASTRQKREDGSDGDNASGGWALPKTNSSPDRREHTYA